MAKIRHTCEALMLLDENERDAADIEEDEVEEAEKIYKLCTTLSNAFIDKFEDEYGRVIERSATISWPFEREDAPDELGWIESVHWQSYGSGNRSQGRIEEAQKLAEEGKELESFYEASISEVTIPTLNRAKIQFINYAMLKATKLLKKIIQVVSSSSFQAAMKRLKGGSSFG